MMYKKIFLLISVMYPWNFYGMERSPINLQKENNLQEKNKQNVPCECGACNYLRYLLVVGEVIKTKEGIESSATKRKTGYNSTEKDSPLYAMRAVAENWKEKEAKEEKNPSKKQRTSCFIIERPWGESDPDITTEFDINRYLQQEE